MIDTTVKIIKNVEIAKNIYEMTLLHDVDLDIKGGQFLQIQLKDNSLLLRRPFCISSFDIEKHTLKVVYQIKGKGTLLLSQTKEGEELNVLLPLGNGFTLSDNHKKIVLLGGGMGSAVLPSIIDAYKDRKFYTYLGFADKDNVILEDLSNRSEKCVICTDNGSYGYKGFVTNILKEQLETINPDIILACGPEPMFKAMQKLFFNCDIPIKISLEGRMGCGFGACLVCICKIKKTNGLDYLRVCKDGPIFDLNEVLL